MKKLHALAPLLLTVAGFVFMGALGIRRLYGLGVTMSGALVATGFGLYGAWLLWESRVSVREVAKDSVDRDRGTMEFAAFAKLSLLTGALLPATVPVVWLAVVGLVLMVLGIVIRGSSVRELGTAYSHRIRLPELPLIVSGPYRFVRHPAYLGTLLAHTGVVFLLPNPWSIGALMLLWCPAVMVRTIWEDRYLRSVPEYVRYAERVRWSLFPGIY